MAKILFEFEGKIIDVFRLNDIEKMDEYDDAKQCLVHRIYFNRNPEELPMLKTYVFDYVSAEFRDDRFEELRIRLEGVEHIKFI